MAGVSRIDDLVYPAVIAHRGGSKSHPENTLQAFGEAIRSGADMIEIDVRLTADRVLVVVHDPHVTTPDCGGALVSDLTLEQLRCAGPTEPAATAIATLREVIDLVRGHIRLEIEIKHLADEPGPANLGPAAAEEVAQLLNELSFEAALVSSFEPRTLDRVRECAPEIATGLETEGPAALAAGLEQCVTAGYAFVLPDVPTLVSAGRDIVDEAHGLGLRVATWVTDEPDVISQLFAMGVDAVETDESDIAIPIRDRVRATRDNSAGRIQ